MKVARGAVVRVLEPETLDPSLDEGEPADLVDPADPTDPTRDH
jgi:hypothetical protein